MGTYVGITVAAAGTYAGTDDLAYATGGGGGGTYAACVYTGAGAGTYIVADVADAILLCTASTVASCCCVAIRVP